MCSEWKMASSSPSSSSRRKKQEVALARTDDYADHYEDEEVESSMLQARGLGAVFRDYFSRSALSDKIQFSPSMSYINVFNSFFLTCIQSILPM